MTQSEYKDLRVPLDVWGKARAGPAVGDAPWREKLTPVASDAADFAHNGVLGLTFTDSAYSWAFHTTAGTVTDSGSDTCH